MTTLNFFSSTSPHGQRLTSLRRRFSMSPVGYDALLFGISSLFALVVAFESKIPLYRQWGQMALGVYVAATLAALGLILVSRRRSVQALRGWLTALVVVGTVLIPLSFEVHWRFSVTPQSLHVQPEVVVIENAANFLAHGHDPYQAIVVNGTLQGGSPGLPAYESFFPYLPAMTLFGLPAATPLPKEATDARLYFVFGTLLAVVLALWYAPTSNNRRLRSFQVAIALPWAALTMATGGDDLPIIGLLLAGMVLAQRRRPGWSGIVFGVACAMKFTAWPVALLALFAARDATGKRRPWLLALGAGVIVRAQGREDIHGLTTAASVWVSAILGMICGLGQWRLALCAFGLAWLILTGGRWVENQIIRLAPPLPPDNTRNNSKNIDFDNPS